MKPSYVCLWRYDGPDAGPLAPLEDEIEIDLSDLAAVDAVPTTMVDDPVSSRTITTPLSHSARSLLGRTPTMPIADATLAALCEKAKQAS